MKNIFIKWLIPLLNLILILLFVIGCSNSQSKTLISGDEDNDGCSDIHDYAPLNQNIPANNLEFGNYKQLNQEIEYAVSQWTTNDKTGISGEISKDIPIPILNDVIKSAIRDYFEFKIKNIEKTPNPNEIKVRVQISITIPIPGISSNNSTNESETPLLNKITKDIKNIGIKKYNASVEYDLTYADGNISNELIDNSSFKWEEVKE